MLRLGAVEGWVVTHDGETIKTGFARDFDAVKWMHQRHSFSVDHAVEHEGYDIVLVKDGKVAYSYRKAAQERKGRRGTMELGAVKTRKKNPIPVWPEFVDAYLEAALWASSVGDDEDPLDKNYKISDFTQKAVDQAVRDANDFILANRKDLEAANSDRSQHGHDFWLTRNHHGAGFWDRDYGAFGDRLTEAAHAYGQVNAYADEDGKVRFE